VFYPATDLVLNAQSEVYHLGLNRENIAQKIIVVGDQDRVALVSSFFDEIHFKKQHREFVCHTGTYRNKKISVISTGIGTDNIDIVINELDALVNINLHTRTEHLEKTKLEIVRIGTCGIVQPEIDIHSYILSTHAFGLDNIAHFYQIPFDNFELNAVKELIQCMQLPAPIVPYFVPADETLTARLQSENTYSGITITSSGFYGPQGRKLRLPTHISDVHDALASFRYDGMKILNFEMESSALFALGKGLGHACTTICLGIANRPKFEFSKGYAKEMNELILYVLDRI
jgi:uridine phosphorylase